MFLEILVLHTPLARRGASLPQPGQVVVFLVMPKHTHTHTLVVLCSINIPRAGRISLLPGTVNLSTKRRDHAPVYPSNGVSLRHEPWSLDGWYDQCTWGRGSCAPRCTGRRRWKGRGDSHSIPRYSSGSRIALETTKLTGRYRAEKRGDLATPMVRKGWYWPWC